MDRELSTYIIAEAGVNHNGSVEMAINLIDEAADAGADAIKFQTFKADKLVVPEARKADYQEAAGVSDSQLEMLRKLELDDSAHHQLIRHCSERGIKFLSTPFDIDSLHLLVDELHLKEVKISSGEITNGPLLLETARSQVQIILSTGMSTFEEIERALSVIAFGYIYPNDTPTSANLKDAFLLEEGKQLLKERVILLHCTTEYPCPIDEVNLLVMDTMKEFFGLPVGYSDHTAGITVPIAAVARGARVIEKHFTLDRNLPGPDHQSSLEPDELAEMIKSIRLVERAMGSSFKKPTISELKNLGVARKSIIAARDIKIGECFDESNICVKRPGTGISPMNYWNVLGSSSTRSYKTNDLI
ncbi:N,N'-diacetyllegionaminic acid synthase [Paenibacillus plantiphilus]|uniref:N,N'-diacetyllegionaminic acid synthase n=1 Tax=Paenibacillus plantiphilus TaxID=2905650 RepID=A0ABM9BU02_9BACL|nr:N,N'-diacetyllegionaminic acid synthase [Paenibacillus plantiphilus]